METDHIFSSGTDEVRSEMVGKVLTACLWAGAAFDLLAIFSRDSSITVLQMQGRLFGLVTLSLRVITVLLFVVWMFQLHGDMEQRFNRYPIGSGQALLQMLIPIYNFWGIWNIYATLANAFQLRSSTVEKGREIRSLLPWLFVIAFIANAASRSSGSGLATSTSMAAGSVSDCLLVLLWLRMTFLIRSGLERLAIEPPEPDPQLEQAGW